MPSDIDVFNACKRHTSTALQKRLTLTARAAAIHRVLRIPSNRNPPLAVYFPIIDIFRFTGSRSEKHIRASSGNYILLAEIHLYRDINSKNINCFTGYYFHVPKYGMTWR